MPLSAPIPTEDTKAFWQAASDGRFLIKHCNQCKKAHWYPREVCPLCFSSDTEWQRATGLGEIYSFTIMRHVPAPNEPFVLAFVTLAEGPTMLAHIACDVADGALAIGAKVKVQFAKSTGDYQVPVFALLKK